MKRSVRDTTLAMASAPIQEIVLFHAVAESSISGGRARLTVNVTGACYLNHRGPLNHLFCQQG